MNRPYVIGSITSKLKRRKFIQYGAIACGTGLMVACNGNQGTTPSTSETPATRGQLDKVTFGTNWFAQPEHGGFYQAVATGIYQAYGLDVTIKMGGPQVNMTQLLMGGAIDFGMGHAIDAIKAVEANIPKVTVAAIFQKDPQVLLAHPNSGNDGLEKLKGKKILLASLANTTFWPFLKAKFGYSDDQKGVYTFNVGPFVADKSLIQQGYVTSEPNLVAKQGGFKPIVLLLADYGYKPYATTIETKKEWVQNKPDLVQRFVEASIKGWYSYLENPAPGNALIKKDNPEMTDDQLIYGLNKLKEYGIVVSGDAEKLGIGAMTKERWREIYDSMTQAGVFKPGVSYEGAFTLQFVNKGSAAYQKA